MSSHATIMNEKNNDSVKVEGPEVERKENEVSASSLMLRATITSTEILISELPAGISVRMKVRLIIRQFSTSLHLQRPRLITLSF